MTVDSRRGRRSDTPAAGEIDYLAKDYESFRRLMLERMAAQVPEWSERNPADVGVAVVEVLAYAADYLSYYQDAVATEAYLDTARLRSSVRRHLRLLGYHLHEGCNGRVWVRFESVSGSRATLAAGTPLLTRAGDLPKAMVAGSSHHREAAAQGSRHYELMHELELRSELNRIDLHRRGADSYTLAEGATSVALAGDLTGSLRSGDVLILEQLPRVAGGAERSEAHLRHPVRLATEPVVDTDPRDGTPITRVEFFDEDALPFPLVVAESTDRGALWGRAVARGNVALADHGETVEEELPVVPLGERYRPELATLELTRREPFSPEAARKRPACHLAQRPEAALPAIELIELLGGEPAGERWSPRRDLLDSRPYDCDFVVETESDGRTRLRFGDGTNGRRPSAGTRFRAVYRVGSGPGGHVGHDALTHVVTTGSPSVLSVTSVTNPLPASGAIAPESLEQARLVAPRAFRATESCVTDADLRRLAESYPGVLSAAAHSVWSGSWRTRVLYVQRLGGSALDARFEDELRRRIEPLLLAGDDLELRPPRPLEVAVRLRVRLVPGAASDPVRSELLAQLGDGEGGFFHPDRWVLGAAVRVDAVVDRASRLAAVESVTPEVFRPWRASDLAGVGAPQEVRAVVETGSVEAVRLFSLDSDTRPRGLELLLEGGA